MKRVIQIGAAILLLLVTLVLGDSIRAQYRQPIQYVIFVSDRQADIGGKMLSWSARRVLLNLRPTEADIAELNADAGARHIAKLNDQAFAQHLLKRFTAKGLNLEALDPSRQWTAVQSVAIEGNAAAVRLLLADGAQPKKNSASGESLLEVLHDVSKADPSADYPGIISALQL